MAETEQEKINLEMERIKLERASLELEEMRDRVATMRSRKEDMQRELQARIASYRDEVRRRAAEQKVCPHRKGGLGIDGFAHGDDGKYAVIRHRLPAGKTIALCTRCLKIWRPGDPGYDEAMSYPTDNSPSSSVQFTFEPVAA